MLNCFGNSGGFNAIINMLIRDTHEKPDDSMTRMIYLVRLLAVPATYYHKDWVKEFGPKVIETVRE